MQVVTRESYRNLKLGKKKRFCIIFTTEVNDNHARFMHISVCTLRISVRDFD